MRTSQKDAEMERLLAQALVVCRKLIEIDRKANGEEWQALAEATALAREVVEQVEENEHA